MKNGGRLYFLKSGFKIEVFKGLNYVKEQRRVPPKKVKM
jgi:hypothetical protein